MLRKAEWPEECSFQALQRLQQMRVRLRPPLQVAQQLRGREELPVRARPGPQGCLAMPVSVRARGLEPVYGAGW